MPNRVPPNNRSWNTINEIDDAVYLFEYAEYLKKEIKDYKGKGNDIVYTPLYMDFYYFLYRSDSTKTITSRFSRFLESKIIGDKYKKDFVVDIALKQPELIVDFMYFDEDELKTTKEKDTALSAGKYLIKESNGEQPILIDYIKHSEEKHMTGAMSYFFLDSELLHYSYAKAIAETGNKKVEEEFAKLFENDPKNNFDKFYSSDIEKYRKKIREEKNSPQESTKEELEAKIRFMNELRKTLDNAKYLASYLCNKEENDNQKSLLAEIVDFRINNLEYSERVILTDILNTVRTENGTLLNYYSQNSKDSLRGFIPNSPDDKKVFLSRLCDKEENDNQKSLLAKIVDFGIDGLETRNQNYFKNLLSNTRYTEDGKTLLDYYSENSTDSEEIKAKTLFYLREFQYVGRYHTF